MAGLSNIGIPSFKNEYGGQERYRPPRTLSTLRFDTAAFKSVIVRFIGKRKGAANIRIVAGLKISRVKENNAAENLLKLGTAGLSKPLRITVDKRPLILLYRRRPLRNDIAANFI